MSLRSPCMSLGGWTGLIPRMLPIVAGWAIFRGAFRFGFAQDDWLRLESALAPFTNTIADIAARGMTGRRPIEELYFAGMVRLFGPSAFAFHLAAVLLHGANVVLVHHLALRVVSPRMALIGAFFFAVHTAAFTVLYWTACAPELLCAILSLAALSLAIAPRRRWRWSIPLYLAALGAKETALFLPAVALALAGAVGLPGAIARRRALLLALTGGLGFGLFYVFWKEGLRLSAYPLDPSAAGVAERFATYLAWAFAFAQRIGFVEKATRLERLLAIAGAIGLLALAFARGGPERKQAALGLIWLAAFTLPAALISGHLYRYLLYLALPGLAFLAAPLLALGNDRRHRRGWRRHLSGAVTIAATLAILAAAERATVRTEGYTVQIDGIWNRHHFVVRRADIAGRVLARLAPDMRALGPEATVILVGADAKRDWWDANVRAALADGAALRVAFGKPDLAVRFTERGEAPVPEPVPGRTLVYLYDPYGRLRQVSAPRSSLIGRE